MEKILFHTITIKIPSHMVYTTKSGLLKLVPTLTKSGNLTKREKVPSIIFKPDNYIIHPEIINGTEIIYPSNAPASHIESPSALHSAIDAT